MLSFGSLKNHRPKFKAKIVKKQYLGLELNGESHKRYILYDLQVV